MTSFLTAAFLGLVSFLSTILVAILSKITGRTVSSDE